MSVKGARQYFKANITYLIDNQQFNNKLKIIWKN